MEKFSAIVTGVDELMKRKWKFVVFVQVESIV